MFQTQHSFIKKSRLNAPVEEVFQWHKTPEAVEKLTPPSENMTILSREGNFEDDGYQVTFLVKMLNVIPVVWVARHSDYIENRQFEDQQLKGPFRYWHHTHLFIPDGDNHCWMEDRVIYELPMGVLGNLFGGPFVKRKIEHMFDHRHRVLETLFNRPIQ